MCEIEFIKRINGNLNSKDIEEFFKLMEFGSLNNSDAFGFFNHNHFFKERGIFNLKGFKYKKLLSGGFIVGHNRLTTTGTEDRNYNNHPFKLNDFIMVHNGIISNDEELRKKFKIKSKIETDSYVILWLINHFFNKSKRKSRVKKMKDAIKKTTKKIDGSYSVFVYDKEGCDLYYFRNSNTDFSFCLLDNKILVGSTTENNLKHIYLNKKYIFDSDLFNERVFKETEEETIYLINDEVIIKEIGKFEEVYNWYSSEITEEEEKELKDKRNMGGYDFYNKEYGIYGNYADKVVKDSEDCDLHNEIDDVFDSLLGYSPFFELINNNQILKITDDNSDLLKELRYLLGDFDYRDGYIYIDTDLFLNSNQTFR